jgi:hypothetical protein
VGSCPIVEYNVIVSAFVMLISCLASSIMKMKVASASGTSVDSQQTMHLYISEDLHFKKIFKSANSTWVWPKFHSILPLHSRQI